MADIIRTATATWQGDLKSGGGTTSTTSGALKDTKISFTTRFRKHPRRESRRIDRGRRSLVL